MLDAQLIIIWKFEWKRTFINDKNWGKTYLTHSLIIPPVLLQFNSVLGECKSSPFGSIYNDKILP